MSFFRKRLYDGGIWYYGGRCGRRVLAGFGAEGEVSGHVWNLNRRRWIEPSRYSGCCAGEAQSIFSMTILQFDGVGGACYT